MSGPGMTDYLLGADCGLGVMETPSREVYINCQTRRARLNLMLNTPMLILLTILMIWLGVNVKWWFFGMALLLTIGVILNIADWAYLAETKAIYDYDLAHKQLDAMLSGDDKKREMMKEMRAADLEREKANIQAAAQTTSAVSQFAGMASIAAAMVNRK